MEPLFTSLFLRLLDANASYFVPTEFALFRPDVDIEIKVDLMQGERKNK